MEALVCEVGMRLRSNQYSPQSQWPRTRSFTILKLDPLREGNFIRLNRLIPKSIFKLKLPIQILYEPKEKKCIFRKCRVQIKRDPTDDNNYRLHLDGKRVFQWFKEKWQSLKQTVKRGFGIQ